MKPTNISRRRKGKDARMGIKKAMTTSRTSPANIFPNKRKAKDMIFDNSDTISRIPTKKFNGLVKLINLVTYPLKPRYAIP